MAVADGKGGKTQNSGAIAFAIFLCSVGTALAVIVVSKLGVHIADYRDAKSLHPLSLWPLLWFFSYLLAVGFIFWGINGARPPRRSYRTYKWYLRNSRISWRARLAWLSYRVSRAVFTTSSLARVVIGAMLLAFSLYALVHISGLTATPAPAVERFALVFEPAPPPAQKDGKSPSAPVTPPEIAREPGRAILLWSVPGSAANPRDGMLAMFLGCVLTVAFGIFYPRMTLSGASDTASFIQKLIIPLISLGLFGVGVQQQAKAEELSQDVELAKQGLPPVMFLDRKERLYVLNRDYLPSSTVSYLDNRVSAQQVNIAEQDGSTDLSGVNRELDAIRAELRKRPIPVTVVSDSALLRELIRSTEQMKRHAAANSRAIKSAVDVARTEAEKNRRAAQIEAEYTRNLDCRALRLAVSNYTASSTNLYQVAKYADEKRKRDIFRNILLSLKGEDRDRVDREREANDASAEGKLSEAQASLKSLCPEQTAPQAASVR